jgi:hypothetical protein
VPALAQKRQNRAFPVTLGDVEGQAV